MRIRQTPTQIWEEYQDGIDYKTAIDLYENVRVNENFYIGRQWEGVNAPDIPKPVLNFLKRVVAYSVAMIVSDDVAVSFAPFSGNPAANAVAALIAGQIERVIEKSDARTMHRRKVRDAAVDGDGIVYLWFDPDVETGQGIKGDIKIESIENINLHPGNPYIQGIQEQPYLILSKRELIDEVREEAIRNGMDEDEANRIGADDDTNQGEKGDNSSLTTVLLKLWKENGTVHAIKATEKAVVKPAWDTGYRLYPVASMRWEEVKSQFFGNSMLTGLIQNQISVNRLFAMTIRSVEMMAFPKVLYDSTKIKQWTNRVGEAIPVIGSVGDQIMTNVRGADVSGQVMQIIQNAVSMTRDFMGASDAALGNVEPNNTSAIIALQKAAAAPLELQRREFYRFVEEYVRIIVDMMRVNYGVRAEIIDDPELAQALVPPELLQRLGGAGAHPVEIDYAAILDDANLQLNVDVGASAYWSELLQNQVMDNLFRTGLITDAETYIESIPAHMLRNKNKILAGIRKKKDAAMQQAQAMLAGQPQGMPTGQPQAMLAGQVPAALSAQPQAQGRQPQPDQLEQLIRQMQQTQQPQDDELPPPDAAFEP